MTKPSYVDFKAEQSEAERRVMLAGLLKFEAQAHNYVNTRLRTIAEDEADIAAAQQALAKKKADLSEVEVNRTAFLKQVSKVADQAVITPDDVKVLNKALLDVNTTAEQREKQAAQMATALNRRYEDVPASMILNVTKGR